MPINPNIPLGTRVAPVNPNQIAGLTQLARQRRLDKQSAEDRQRKRQFEDEDRATAAEDRDFRLEDRDITNAAARAKNLDERQTRRLNSSIIAAARLNDFLEAGDTAGAESFLQQRRESITRGQEIDPTLDTNETDDAIRRLREDPEGLKQLTTRSIALGEQLGILKDGASDKGFTLSAGQQRFGASGKLIAGVAAKPDNQLTEIADPSSPTGTRFVRRAEAIGQPGKPPSGTSLTVAPDGTVTLDQGRVGPGGKKLTAGAKKVDEVFAKTYVEWRAQGGFADANKGLEQLREVSIALKGGANLTGPALGVLPDLVKGFSNPKAISVREAAEEVVQRNLRLILGAQFTEKEGDRLIARAFNPRLDEAENAKRIDRLIRSIAKAKRAKDSAADYFEQNGTLRGWSGKQPTKADFNKLDFDKPEVFATNPDTGAKMVWDGDAWVPVQ